MEAKQSYYPVLGVNSNSSLNEIRRAYRRLAMQWHPNRWASTPSLLGEANRKFQKIQEAYSLLSDPAKRSVYDAGLYDPTDEYNEDQKAHEAILKVLNLDSYWRESTLEEWKSRAEIYDKLNELVRIANVGNFTCHSDAYHSVVKALMHASVARRKKLVINWVEVQNLEDSTRIENPENFNTAWNMLKVASTTIDNNARNGLEDHPPSSN